MFRARFTEYWCDSCMNTKTLCFNNIKEVLEYVYEKHKNSNYPQSSRFSCRGDRNGIGGYLDADCCLDEKYGYRGSIWLEEITYSNTDEVVIVFSKYSKYISPKTSKAFDDFSNIAKQREMNKKFGDF